MGSRQAASLLVWGEPHDVSSIWAKKGVMLYQREYPEDLFLINTWIMVERVTSHLPRSWEDVEVTKAYRALCGFLEEKGIAVPKSYVTWRSNIASVLTESHDLLTTFLLNLRRWYFASHKMPSLIVPTRYLVMKRCNMLPLCQRGREVTWDWIEPLTIPYLERKEIEKNMVWSHMSTWQASEFFFSAFRQEVMGVRRHQSIWSW